MKNLILLSKQVLIGLFLSTIISCSSTPGSTSDSQPKDSTIQNANIKKPKRVEVFNDVNKLTANLSENGIGQLKQWSDPIETGYGSATDYYQFGGESQKNGMKNNIAYYIEGTEIQADKIYLT